MRDWIPADCTLALWAENLLRSHGNSYNSLIVIILVDFDTSIKFPRQFVQLPDNKKRLLSICDYFGWLWYIDEFVQLPEQCKSVVFVWVTLVNTHLFSYKEKIFSHNSPIADHLTIIINGDWWSMVGGWMMILILLDAAHFWTNTWQGLCWVLCVWLYRLSEFVCIFVCVYVFLKYFLVWLVISWFFTAVKTKKRYLTHCIWFISVSCLCVFQPSP